MSTFEEARCIGGRNVEIIIYLFLNITQTTSRKSNFSTASNFLVPIILQGIRCMKVNSLIVPAGVTIYLQNLKRQNKKKFKPGSSCIVIHVTLNNKSYVNVCTLSDKKVSIANKTPVKYLYKQSKYITASLKI